MKTLDLEKLYNVLCTVRDKEDLLKEGGKYYNLLNDTSIFYSNYGFDRFILDYSFSFTPLDIYSKQGIKDIVVSRSYWIDRDCEVNEEIYVPIQLLSLSPGELEEWIENRIKECETEEANNKKQEIGIKLAELRNSLLQTKSHEISTADIIEIITAETEEEFKEIVKKIVR